MRVRLHGEKEREKNIIDALAAKPAAIDVAAHANRLVVDALCRCDLGALLFFKSGTPPRPEDARSATSPPFADLVEELRLRLRDSEGRLRIL
ncbi:hypothetical protein EYF80_030224 [Liparis tanakae]|uniref:Uncharacterized protein n=1 Tax=Liparis tanakae TaxID=230148 RepID=A0A4Z2H424_9TELE|nr:hypothetical protein EYF80_030224 [Liparis tanakae]